MTGRESTDWVKIWEETVVIPTYPAPPPDANPMFLEKRVYQGSSGKVYPNPFTDRLSDHKRDQPYRAVFLENEYIQVMILPEIGGRIHRGFDKTNQYDFFYHQHVIKPALVGLLGPWISGGVEFNWPQHHRPSTFMPLDYFLHRHEDGSATVWLSEHEPMNRMKGMAGIRLYPHKNLVEIRAQIYNRTPFPQTFLWWANAGVHVHDQYEAFFPPDVTWVADHAKRAVSDFPIAHGFYYGVDYARGVDLRWYRNIPVPTSYMATGSRYDFVGGYDHLRQAGLVHIADHHIAPGKKLWTWGNGEFGKAWDRELTDSDGPYIELMSGVFTDNQPDFSWLHPFETRTFHHCWYPIQRIGPVRNANSNAALNLDIQGDRATLGICVTEPHAKLAVTLTCRGKILLQEIEEVSPAAPFVRSLVLPGGINPSDLMASACASDGRELIRYAPETLGEKHVPAPAIEPPLPEDLPTVDELYVVGLHLDQYRHATRKPEAYWGEALKREAGDSRSNNAMGVASLRRGNFQEAEHYFRRAISRLTERNPNPRDGEAYYNLGLALKFEQQFSEAYDAFVKATWNYAWQSASYYALAEIDCRQGSYATALEWLERSLDANSRHSKAKNLKAAILRRLDRNGQAEQIARETASMDQLDFWARNEVLLARRASGDLAASSEFLSELSALMRDHPQTYLDIAFDYAGAGFFEDAVDLLGRLPSRKPTYPMVLYALGYFHQQLGNKDGAIEFYRRASKAPSDYCFPAQLEEMIVLKSAQEVYPSDGKACYYLGNLLYDKQRYEEAIENWERSSELDSGFAIAWRNLGIAYFNVRHDPDRALASYRKAFDANPTDGRLLYEMDQLKKRLGSPLKERLGALEQRRDLVNQRDDLTVELAALYNQVDRPEKALELLLPRRFHPWEGGEGLVSGQYVWAHFILGQQLLTAGQFAEALQHFEAGRRYPETLGEGKHLLTPENHLHYFCGLARKELGETAGAKEDFERATKLQPIFSQMTYYRALAYKELGDQPLAGRLLQELLETATQKLQAEVKIEYFATSLPNFLLFEDDLQKRNRVECLYLIALAQRGLGRIADAKRSLREAIALDVSHLGAQQQLRVLHARTKTA